MQPAIIQKTNENKQTNTEHKQPNNAEFYDPLHTSVEMVDTFLKHHFDLNKSKIEMTTEELQELIEWSIVFGQGIGLELSYPKDELDDMLDFKDLK